MATAQSCCSGSTRGGAAADDSDVDTTAAAADTSDVDTTAGDVDGGSGPGIAAAAAAWPTAAAACRRQQQQPRSDH